MDEHDDVSSEIAPAGPQGAELLRLRSLFEQMPAMVSVYEGPDHVCIYANGMFRRFVGDREVIGRPLRDALPELVGQGVLERLDEAYRTGRRTSREERHVRLFRGGPAAPEDLVYIGIVEPWTDPDGRVRGVIGFDVDVTDLARANDRLRQGEARLRAILGSLPVGVIVAEAPSRRIVLGNAEFKRILGAPSTAPMVGAAGPGWTALHPDGQPLMAAEDPLAQALAGRRVDSAELLYRRDDGSTVWCRAQAAPIRDEQGQVAGGVMAIVDVSERKRAEGALRESEARYRSLFEGSNDAILIQDLATRRLVEANERAEQLTGYTREELLALWPGHLLPEADRPRAYRNLRILREQGTLRDEIELLTRDGRRVPVEFSARAIRLDGRLLVQAVFRDVTERRTAEAALRASHARIEEILESIDEAFYALDHDWRFTYVNGGAERLWGRRREELLGRPAAEVFPSWEGSESHRAHLAAAASRAPVRIETVSAVIGRPLEIAIYPSPSGLSVYFRDVSELKQALAAKDLMMRELHHRVNNTMQLIVSLLNLQTTAIKDAAARQLLAEAQDRVRALAEVQRRLYEAGRMGTLEFAGYLRDICRSLGESASGARACRIDIEADEAVLPGDQAISLALIVNELATNAIKYAYPGGGDIALAVRFEHLADGTIRLSVADEGVGLPEGFDPARSEGLGMRLVIAMAQRLGGRLEIGRCALGARFVVTIPGDVTEREQHGPTGRPA